ncbi:hypothetical protein AQUCO_00901098v1, partial [Aquilegia coerulea]
VNRHPLHSLVANNCNYSVWQSSNPDIGNELSEAPPGSVAIFETPVKWTGSIWFRTGCSLLSSDENYKCETGDCGTGKLCGGGQPTYPVTLVNFSIDQSSVTYEISLIHGFNIPISVMAEGACPTVDCTHDLIKDCPAELLFKNSQGSSVGCRNPCDAMKDPLYCCNSTDQGCQPNKFSDGFKQFCPNATIYPWDVNPPKSECMWANNYTITMCPTT